MRSLDECQAEVFRRGEKKIKQRKQYRKRMLLACVPLMLCLAVLSMTVLPGVMTKAPEDNGFTEAAMGGLSQESYESFFVSIEKITVSGPGFVRSYTNAADILMICDRLNTYMEEEAVSNETAGDMEEEPVSNETAGETLSGDDLKDADGSAVAESYHYSANAGYTVTFVTYDGEKTGYYLAGKTLKNLTTNQTHTLSQNQVNELIELLGIPHR